MDELNVWTTAHFQFTWALNSTLADPSLSTSDNLTSSPYSEEPAKTTGNLGAQLIGLPGPTPIFYIIHVVALVALASSIISSGVVIIYQLYKEKGQDFWKYNIGERLAVYLAICDLLHHVTHFFDHFYVLVSQSFLPDVPCKVFGFILMEFSQAQSVVVTYTALGACVMIVREGRLSLGRYDYRLGMASLGIPLILTISAAATNSLGPSGGWCAMDLSKKYGFLLSNVLTIDIIITFFINLICYLLVGLKIKQISRSMAAMDERAAANSKRYQRSVRMMMLFVAVYITQWWAYVVFFMWGFFAIPPLMLNVPVVTFTNLGGLFNLIAYIYVRRGKRRGQDSMEKSKKYKNRTDNSPVTCSTLS